ncbi:MAG: arsenite efflux transporter metallochaperone ArsD [Sporomusaceae bacterium]|nr:arsenite efflux transporter metallochaperone ArsD [Sporomusaceae bacterium]
MMSKIEIFDPAMCCETGICGPSIDKELLRVATTIKNLTAKGADITRFGLANQPQAFISYQKVNELLLKEEAEVLPITLVDGEVKKTRLYPTDAEFVAWSGIELDAPSESQEKDDGGCCCSGGCC